jgi:hypothetical protein
MGCGKTEAALFAAQQLIAASQQHGLYFALPTQVTSYRIHRRIERFLRATLQDEVALRWHLQGLERTAHFTDAKLAANPSSPLRGRRGSGGSG